MTQQEGRRRPTPVEAGAVGAGALLGARQLVPEAPRPLSRKGQRVRRKLERSKKDTVKLTPRQWAEISGGRGNRAQNDEYTARMAQAIKAKKLSGGGTTARVYGDTVRTTGGHHRAHANTMLGRKIPVTVTGRSKKNAPKLPRFIARRDRLGSAEQRLKLREHRSMSSRRLNEMAGAYTKRSHRWNSSVLSSAKGRAKVLGGLAALSGGGALAHHQLTKADEQRRSAGDRVSGAVQLAGTSAAAAGGGAAAYRYAHPVPYAPLSRKGERVHRKLRRKGDGTVKLSPREWAAIAGGRGGRRDNDAYTARMARSLRAGKLAPGGTEVVAYRDTVKQIGGAHRAQAHSMLGRRVPVTVRTSERSAPRLPAFIGERENRGAAEQRKRLKETRGMSRRKLKRLANQYSPAAEKANARKSKAEDVAMKLVGTKTGRAGLAALLAGGGAAAYGLNS